MFVHVDKKVFDAFGGAQIGYLVAQVNVTKSDPFVEKLKEKLFETLLGKGINATNFAIHESIAIWRKIYENNFKVKAKTYRSSLEALVKRVVTGKQIWSICNIVDLYNCCSVHSMLPMGGYDLGKISGDIAIRFGQPGEKFRGLGLPNLEEVMEHHLVYADDARVLCWLWNYKDAEESCIDEHTKEVVFFIDSANEASSATLNSAIDYLKEMLSWIGCVTTKKGVLNKEASSAQLI